MKKSLFALLIAAVFTLNAWAAGTIFVDIVDDAYHAVDLTVPLGSTVTWINFGMHTHTVTSNTNLFNSGDILPGQSFSFTFNTVGDYAYHCIYHPTLMNATVHARTSTNMTFALTLTPVNPPIVIPAGGGTFSYTAQGTNLTNVMQNTTFWTKIYPPNNGLPFQTISKGVSLPPGGSRGATIQQSVAGTSPAGLYTFVGNVGSNPDTVRAWSTFTFTKSAVLIDGTGWESVLLEDWHDVPTPAASNPATPQKLELLNYPEPFNPSTTIQYGLPTEGLVRLEVFNASGARVATLIDGIQAAGEHQTVFDASNLPSGLYIYRLNFAGQTISNKMMLIK